MHRLALGSRGHLTHLLPWAAVALFDRSGVRLQDVGPLEAFTIDRHRIPLADDELLLGRDVLDTQIIDVAGHRLARVSDVLLTRLTDGGLEVVAVEVGMSAVWRRLGLRWLGKRLPQHAIEWPDLHLRSGRGHALQLATTIAAVHRLDAQDLAELLTRLDLTSATEVIKATGPGRAAGAIARAHPEIGHRLIQALPPDDAAAVLDELPSQPGERYRRTLRRRSPVPQRRFLRWRGWRLHRPPQVDGSHPRSRRTNP